eukprot:Clim_evm12s44 gene=Clim_evmTU12s44
MVERHPPAIQKDWTVESSLRPKSLQPGASRRRSFPALQSSTVKELLDPKTLLKIYALVSLVVFLAAFTVVLQWHTNVPWSQLLSVEEWTVGIEETDPRSNSDNGKIMDYSVMAHSIDSFDNTMLNPTVVLQRATDDSPVVFLSAAFMDLQMLNNPQKATIDLHDHIAYRPMVIHAQINTDEFGTDLGLFKANCVFAVRDKEEVFKVPAEYKFEPAFRPESGKSNEGLSMYAQIECNRPEAIVRGLQRLTDGDLTKLGKRESAMMASLEILNVPNMHVHISPVHKFVKESQAFVEVMLQDSRWLRKWEENQKRDGITEYEPRIAMCVAPQSVKTMPKGALNYLEYLTHHFLLGVRRIHIYLHRETQRSKTWNALYRNFLSAEGHPLHATMLGEDWKNMEGFKKGIDNWVFKHHCLWTNRYNYHYVIFSNTKRFIMPAESQMQSNSLPGAINALFRRRSDLSAILIRHCTVNTGCEADYRHEELITQKYNNFPQDDCRGSPAFASVVARPDKVNLLRPNAPSTDHMEGTRGILEQGEMHMRVYDAVKKCKTIEEVEDFQATALRDNRMRAWGPVLKQAVEAGIAKIWGSRRFQHLADRVNKRIIANHTLSTGVYVPWKDPRVTFAKREEKRKKKLASQS